jgi:hypothetical protein
MQGYARPRRRPSRTVHGILAPPPAEWNLALLLLVSVVPAAYLIGLGVLFSRGRRRGIAPSLVAFALALAAGGWAVVQSRSSTAGLGFLFLPLIATLAGALGWAFQNLRAARGLAARVAAWACLLGAVAVVGGELNVGRETIAKNRGRDAEQRARTLRIERNRADIAQRLAQVPGQEAATLAMLVREHEVDPEFLMAAFESRFASPEDLDRFARADDLSLTLTVLRNASCRADTLVRIHRIHSYPDYFLQALAAHPNTPPELLREIHGQEPRRIQGLDHWLARNPSTPPDILDALARSADLGVIQGLLQNPGVSCAMLPEIARSLRASSRPDDGYSTRRIAELQADHCR